MSDFYNNESIQAVFFSDTKKRFEKAADLFEKRVPISLAGVCIELRFASQALHDILVPSLRHLRLSDGEKCEMCIGLWDQASSGISAPPPPFDKKRFTDRGDIWGFNSQRFRLAFHYGEFSVNLFDRHAGQGFFWIEDPARLPYWTQAAPLRSQLHWCMELRGRQLLHAAAVGTADGAFLIAGHGGIGKSTTALNALLQGMDFAGDDYVVVSLDPEPRVHTLYCSAKVNRDQLNQYKTLWPWLRNPAGEPDEKAIFDLLPAHSDRLPEFMPIRAILVPEIRNQQHSVLTGNINADEIRHAVSFTTVEQLPYAGRYTYTFIDELTKQIPGYQLILGSERDQVVSPLLSYNEKTPVLQSKPKHSEIDTLPLVTVIIPAYNREDMLGDAITNAIEQDYPRLELIVIDDGSSDGTSSVARGFSEVRLFSQPNSGPAQARNRGIINARGKYIAFLDSDDLWLKNILIHLVESLESTPSADVSMGWPQLARIKKAGDYEYEGNPREGFPNYITGSLFRREVFNRVGLFDADLRFGEDNDWFNRARERGVKVIRLDCTSVVIRRHGGNMTHGKNLVQLNVLRVFKKSLDRKRKLERNQE